MIGSRISHRQEAMENKLSMPLHCCQYTGEGGKGVKVDVMKLEYEFDNARTSNVLTDSKFKECFKRFVDECEFLEKPLISYAQTAQTNLFFSNSTYHTN